MLHYHVTVSGSPLCLEGVESDVVHALEGMHIQVTCGHAMEGTAAMLAFALREHGYEAEVVPTPCPTQTR